MLENTAFATGADTVHPTGFLQILQLNFCLPRGEDAAPFPAQYPRANTCISCLCLPVHYDYEYFKGKMEFAFCKTRHCEVEPDHDHSVCRSEAQPSSYSLLNKQVS